MDLSILRLSRSVNISAKVVAIPRNAPPSDTKPLLRLRLARDYSDELIFNAICLIEIGSPTSLPRNVVSTSMVNSLWKRRTQVELTSADSHPGDPNIPPPSLIAMRSYSTLKEELAAGEVSKTRKNSTRNQCFSRTQGPGTWNEAQPQPSLYLRCYSISEVGLGYVRSCRRS